ncbi:MAG: GNAT family N-acetyltransferase [Sphingobium sp.]|nr:GNAT family N-acetyltransferase [Sphingobium sp.]
MAEIIATTDRLILRTQADGDLANWMTHLNTPDVTAHLAGVLTEEDVVKKFARMAKSQAEQGFSFMMVTLKDGTFLGTVGMAPIENENIPDNLRGAVQIGWQLRADHWGRGYAHEAARAVIALAFQRHGIEILYSQTSPANVPSWRLMEKLGLKRREDLDYEDPAFPPADNPTIVYALAREDWRA